MKFDPYAFLAKDHAPEPQSGAIRANRAIPAPENSTNSTISTGEGLGAESVPPASLLLLSSVQRPAHPARKPSAPAPSRLDGVASLGIADDAPRALCSVTGRPMTWTGRVVSLDAWRRLSAWERHGPDGRLFCGICRAWVAAGTFPHCHAGGAA